MKSGNFNFLETYVQLQACNGSALTFLVTYLPVLIPTPIYISLCIYTHMYMNIYV